MRTKRFCCLWVLPTLLAAAGGVHGEVVFSGSSTTLTGNMQIDASQGMVSGQNLFQSFSVFNVQTGESVDFTGPNSIHNVISRVAGGTSSLIDGPVSVDIPGANFYFINPNGVVFGPNGSINATGSVYVSTADAVRLADGGVFYADPTKNSTLTTADPVAFGFLSAHPAPMEVQGSVLLQPVQPGKTFALVGGDINIDDGAYVYVPGATVSLASVASVGDVPLGTAAPDLSGFTTLGQIQLSGASAIDVTDYDGSTGAGSIYIRGGNLTLSPGALLAQSYDGNPDGVIDIVLRGDLNAETDPATGIISLIGTDWQGFPQGSGAVINLMVGGTLTISNESVIDSVGYPGSGKAGDITIHAGNIVVQGDNTGYFTGINAENDGDAAGPSLSITTGSLKLLNGGFIGTHNSGMGTGGALSINADSVLATGTGDVTLSVSTETTGGTAGNMTINTRTLDLSDGARISSSTGGPGNAGDLNISASQQVDIDGGLSGIFSATAAGANGNAGMLTVKTPLLQVNGGVIDSTTVGDGNAGAVEVKVHDLQLTGGGQIRSFSGGYDTSNNNALVVGNGNAGSVNVVASGSVTISGSGKGRPSGLLAETRGVGGGGDVTVSAGGLAINDGATISSSSKGGGLAGNVEITLADSLDMHDGSIATQAVTSDGGNISISAPRLIHLVDSQITTSVQSGVGGGGNIAIDPQFVVLQNSQIIANAYGGPGGNINIVAGQLIADPATSITASSALGIDGTVNIVAPESDVSAGLAVLPASFLDAASLMQAGCGAARAGLSSLVEVGRGGLPPDPDDYLPSLDLDATVRNGSGPTPPNHSDGAMPGHDATGMVAFTRPSDCQR